MTLDEDHFSPHKVFLCYFSETWWLWHMTCDILDSRKHKNFLPEHGFLPSLFLCSYFPNPAVLQRNGGKLLHYGVFQVCTSLRTLDALLENSRWSGGSSHPVLPQFTLPNWRLITQVRERYNLQSYSSTMSRVYRKDGVTYRLEGRNWGFIWRPFSCTLMLKFLKKPFISLATISIIYSLLPSGTSEALVIQIYLDTPHK